MNIEPYDILDLVHGALYTAVTEEGQVRFARFTEQQKENYALKNFAHKCDGSSGITLDFYSDTNRFSFEAELSRAASRLCGDFDLWVDGVFVDSIQVAIDCCSNISFDLPQGEHRITLYLPWSSITVLRNLEIDDGATLTPVEKGMRILALGDSITQGSIAAHPSMTYVNSVARRLNAEVLNQGIGGYQFLKESLLGAPDWQPDLITLAYGTNDFSLISSANEYKAQVRTYMQTLTASYPDTPILAITPIYRGDMSINTIIKDKDYTFLDAMDILRGVFAEFEQVEVLDGLSFFPHHADFFAPDFLHPNDLGFSLYAQAVSDKILKMS